MAKDNRRMCSFRLTEEDIYKLEMLSTMSGENKSDCIHNMIFATYDKISNNQELKKAIEQLKEIQGLLKNINPEITKN